MKPSARQPIDDIVITGDRGYTGIPWRGRRTPAISRGDDARNDANQKEEAPVECRIELLDDLPRCRRVQREPAQHHHRHVADRGRATSRYSPSAQRHQRAVDDENNERKATSGVKCRVAPGRIGRLSGGSRRSPFSGARPPESPSPRRRVGMRGGQQAGRGTSALCLRSEEKERTR